MKFKGAPYTQSSQLSTVAAVASSIPCMVEVPVMVPASNYAQPIYYQAQPQFILAQQPVLTQHQPILIQQVQQQQQQQKVFTVTVQKKAPAPKTEQVAQSKDLRPHLAAESGMTVPISLEGHVDISSLPAIRPKELVKPVPLPQVVVEEAPAAPTISVVIDEVNVVVEEATPSHVEEVTTEPVSTVEPEEDDLVKAEEELEAAAEQMIVAGEAAIEAFEDKLEAGTITEVTPLEDIEFDEETEDLVIDSTADKIEEELELPSLEVPDASVPDLEIPELNYYGRLDDTLDFSVKLSGVKLSEVKNI